VGCRDHRGDFEARFLIVGTGPSKIPHPSVPGLDSFPGRAFTPRSGLGLRRPRRRVAVIGTARPLCRSSRACPRPSASRCSSAPAWIIPSPTGSTVGCSAAIRDFPSVARRCGVRSGCSPVPCLCPCTPLTAGRGIAHLARYNINGLSRIRGSCRAHPDYVPDVSGWPLEHLLPRACPANATLIASGLAHVEGSTSASKRRGLRRTRIIFSTVLPGRDAPSTGGSSADGRSLAERWDGCPCIQGLTMSGSPQAHLQPQAQLLRSSARPGDTTCASPTRSGSRWRASAG